MSGEARKIKYSMIFYFIVGSILLYTPPILFMLGYFAGEAYFGVIMGIGCFMLFLGILCIVDKRGRTGGVFEMLIILIPAFFVVFRFLDLAGIGLFLGIYFMLVLIYLDIQLRMEAKRTKK